jgi:hypothetical protein
MSWSVLVGGTSILTPAWHSRQPRKRLQRHSHLAARRCSRRPGVGGAAGGWQNAAGRRSGRLRCVSESVPDLHMLNLVVADMAASLAFYRRLGIAGPEGQDTAAAHVQLRMPGASASSSTPRNRRGSGTPDGAPTPRARAWSSGSPCRAREAVDERYAELTSAGYARRQPPFDAFWGARWRSYRSRRQRHRTDDPVDQSRRTWPPEQSPDP